MKKVLICDDSLLIRRQLTDFLKQNRKDVEIIEASNGKEALEKYKVEKPALVLLDIVMPEMDGIRCLKELRAYDPTAKVVVLSSLGNKETLKMALDAGAVDFVQKPWNESVINKVIDIY